MRARWMRRWVLGGAMLVVAIAGAWAAASQNQAAAPPKQTPADRLEALEAASGRRLGVAALDTGTGWRVEYRAGERFAMCSTFKLLLAAVILARVDTRQESLDRPVGNTAANLLTYAPVTKEHAKEGTMTVGALCAAAVEVSDNTAANLLLKILGGPNRFTRVLRSLGDEVTRLDRNEPSLNSNEPGDERDTTTPAAMLQTMKSLLVGDGLSPTSRIQLQEWLLASTTGAARLRAGVPASWRVGDKTGTGANGATNDVAILWPPGRAPILVAAYSSGSKGTDDERSAVLAEVARIVVSATETQK